MLIYGSMLCPDCVQCCKDLDESGSVYTFCDFADDLAHLKAFLKIREKDPDFDEIKREGKIGIPCLVKENGTISLSW